MREAMSVDDASHKVLCRLITEQRAARMSKEESRMEIHRVYRGRQYAEAEDQKMRRSRRDGAPEVGADY